jgi:hypothetical protein
MRRPIFLQLHQGRRALPSAVNPDDGWEIQRLVLTVGGVAFELRDLS